MRMTQNFRKFPNTNFRIFPPHTRAFDYEKSGTVPNFVLQLDTRGFWYVKRSSLQMQQLMMREQQRWSSQL